MRNISVLLVLIALCLLMAACPGGGSGESQPDEPATEVAPGGGSSGSPGEVPATADDNTTPSGNGGEEPAPESQKMWKFEGLPEGTTPTFDPSSGGEIEMKFVLAANCHYNDDAVPLTLKVKEKPEGVTIEPAELTFSKGADIPESIKFKVTGVKPGSSGKISFDVAAAYCSDDGFCVMTPDIVEFDFSAGEPGSLSAYTILYTLDPGI
ncbi:MAG: hypothetical protein HRF49_04620 [bacterium]|jgi:hypothetical protein